VKADQKARGRFLGGSVQFGLTRGKASAIAGSEKAPTVV
jgi:hypothetical protein